MNLFYKKIADDKGFTLIELIVVMAIMAILSMLTIPRLANYFGNKRQNFALITAYITNTFDDSFLNDKINYLKISLYEPNMEFEDMKKESQRNGITVVNLEKGQFVQNKRKIFKFRKFPNSFQVKEVIRSNGEKITTGSALIPFYPAGYSDNVILHILINDEDKWSIRIFKHKKEPEIVKDYITFENL